MRKINIVVVLFSIFFMMFEGGGIPSSIFRLDFYHALLTCRWSSLIHQCQTLVGADFNRKEPYAKYHSA